MINHTQPSGEDDKMRFHELAVEMGEFMTVREENVSGTTIEHLSALLNTKDEV
jgi:hypothetical protein